MVLALNLFTALILEVSTYHCVHKIAVVIPKIEQVIIIYSNAYNLVVRRSLCI